MAEVLNTYQPEVYNTSFNGNKSHSTGYWQSILCRIGPAHLAVRQIPLPVSPAPIDHKTYYFNSSIITPGTFSGPFLTQPAPLKATYVFRNSLHLPKVAVLAPYERKNYFTGVKDQHYTLNSPSMMLGGTLPLQQYGYLSPYRYLMESCSFPGLNSQYLPPQWLYYHTPQQEPIAYSPTNNGQWLKPYCIDFCTTRDQYAPVVTMQSVSPPLASHHYTAQNVINCPNAHNNRIISQLSNPATLLPMTQQCVAGTGSHRATQRSLSSNKISNKESAGAGGHADAFILLGNDIAKLTSITELEVYQDRKNNGLDSVIPKHRLENQLSTAEQEKIQPLKQARKKGHDIIVMEKAGANIPTENKRELDIKIGAATASRSQLARDGYSMLSARTKKERHNILDTITGSQDRGYRLEGAKIHGCKLVSSRLSLSRHTRSNLKQMLDLPKDKMLENTNRIIEQLTNIKQAIRNANITFIASSVLILIDDHQPENTEVKLIDLAHPIKNQKASRFIKSKNQFLKGISNLIRDIECIQIAQQLVSPNDKRE